MCSRGSGRQIAKFVPRKAACMYCTLYPLYNYSMTFTISYILVHNWNIIVEGDYTDISSLIQSSNYPTVLSTCFSNNRWINVTSMRAWVYCTHVALIFVDTVSWLVYDTFCFWIWMHNLFIYIVIKCFHFFISAAIGAAAPGCSGNVNAAD